MIATPNHSSIPLDANGEPIKLPENLESLPRADHFPSQRHRWNTNEEIAATLISFSKHAEWQSKEVKIRPKSGSMLLYSRKKVRYRRDGYCWKKRKDGKTTREDHMKLKVQGTECIYGCYVHSAILPTFHRRCYWLLQNPDIVLVHYLNVPYPDDNKLSIVTPNISLWADKKEWTKEELVSQLKPMFFSEDEPDLNNELEISTVGTVEAIVSQLMEKQRVARQTALLKQLECGCTEGMCTEGKNCTNPIRKIPKQTHAQSKNTRNQLNLTQRNSKLHQNTNLQQVEKLNENGNIVISQNVDTREVKNHHINQKSSSLVLSLSQFEGGGGLLILNSGSTVHNATFNQQKSFAINGVNQNTKTEIQNSHFILRQEIMDLASTLNLDKNIKKEIKYQCAEPKQEFQNYGQCLKGTTIKNAKMIEINGIEHKPRNKDHNYYNSILLIDTNSETPSLEKHNSFVSSSFYETLDLSQEDIQKTLTANMPLSTNNLMSTEHQNGDHKKSNEKSIDVSKNNLDINPMEFISSCDAVGSPSPTVDDDVFVNLEAFDMLSEFPDLDVLDPSHNLLDSVNPSDSKLKIDDKLNLDHGHSYVHSSNFEVTAKITDYSPEWAYPEGGSKVLVTGPWVSSKIYHVLFDNFSVPTTLVQNGVLRCFCPAHEVGLATLQVVCNGCVISNAVIFEYKLPPQGTAHMTLGQQFKGETINENYLKFTLMQRLEALNNQVNIKEEQTLEKVQDSMMLNEANFEDRLVNFCQNTLVQILNRGGELGPANESVNGMTLIHLAASLGYCKLLSCMLQWKREMSSVVLESEVDALSRDQEGFTPLMWACVNGHLKTAVMLYKWNPSALNVRNNHNQTAMELARKNKHNSLVYQLEEMENNQDKGFCLSSFRTDASSSECNSTDDIFLRPGSVSSTFLPNFQVTNQPGKLTKRPSVDSGIFIICNQENNNKSKNKIKDSQKFSKFDRSLSCPSTSPKDLDLDFNMKMDFCNELSNADRSHSPLIDVEAISDDDGTNEDKSSSVGDQDARVLTLAEQIIAAIPDRIKHESEDMLALGSSLESLENNSLSEIFSDSSLQQTSMSIDHTEFNFDDHNYRYYDVSTPCSSLSPSSSSCLQSPSSFLMDSPTPPPTTADFTEFLQASGSFFEKDFSNLTLSDQEQRELYEAAKIIQKAYRSYKGRLQQEQNRERAAAVVIQNYYRRYKQYAYFKQMTHAAMVIQNGFRKYKQNQESYLFMNRDYNRENAENTGSTVRFKRACNQRRQNQAAKKIQQFMRQSKKNVWENGYGSITSERTGRKREAGNPVSGCPPKVNNPRGIHNLH